MKTSAYHVIITELLRLQNQTINMWQRGIT